MESIMGHITMLLHISGERTSSRQEQEDHPGMAENQKR